jgi:hypothetical protein
MQMWVSSVLQEVSISSPHTMVRRCTAEKPPGVLEEQLQQFILLVR